MELRHLKYMVAVAEEMQFSLAAKRLHIAQPALTRNIQQLESDMGTQLFFRTTRKVSLTAAGMSFYRDAVIALAKLEDISRNVRRASLGEAGAISIGFTEVALFGPLNGVLARFRRQFPQVEIMVKGCPVTTLIKELREGTLDVAFTEECVPGPGLAMKGFPKVDVVVALHEQHPLAVSREPIALKELADETFILPPRDTTWMAVEMFTNACAKAGFRPKREYAVEDAITAIALVAAGMGVAPVPSFCSLQVGRVIYRRVISPQIRMTPHMIWCKDRLLSTVLENFIKLR